MVSINDPGDLNLSPFDLETGMRVTSEVGNLHSEFGHARPSGSQVIRYVRNGRTDRRTEKSNAYLPPSYGWGHNKSTQRAQTCQCQNLKQMIWYLFLYFRINLDLDVRCICLKILWMPSMVQVGR